MRINTIEDSFDYQAKEILKKAITGFDLDNLDDVEEFQDEIWEKKHIAEEIGKKFIEMLNEYSGDEIFEEVMDELREEKEEE